MPGALTLTKSISCTVRKRPSPPDSQPLPSLLLTFVQFLLYLGHSSPSPSPSPSPAKAEVIKKSQCRPVFSTSDNIRKNQKVPCFLLRLENFSSHSTCVVSLHHGCFLCLISELENLRQPRNNGTENVRRLDHALVKNNEQRHFVVAARQPATKKPSCCRD